MLKKVFQDIISTDVISAEVRINYHTISRSDYSIISTDVISAEVRINYHTISRSDYSIISTDVISAEVRINYHTISRSDYGIILLNTTLPINKLKEDGCGHGDKKSNQRGRYGSQYDEKAKRLLGNKIILAHILVKTVNEFRKMEPEDVVPYIEGEPYISAVPVEPGQTNAAKGKNGQRIVGLNTESAEINEGLVRFDIVFYVRMKDGISQIIVNLEAQKDIPSGYHIWNRAVFYVSRLISSQKERDFVKTHYDDIKPVYSIRICMNMEENSMDYVHLTNDRVLGSSQWKGGPDLLNIVLIGITGKLPEHDENYELHRLLSAMLSIELSTDEKLGIMETEYNIPINDKMREDVNAMCNLSQGIREKGRAEGRARGGVEKEEKIILNMYTNHFTLEQIALATGRSIEDIRVVIEKKEYELV